jgi:23S rRNA (cytosine1962-C5)-methyltransferase
MEMEVWEKPGKKAIVLEKLSRAIAARAPLRAAGTDALRLVDGAGDGLEGLELDDFAGRWLAQTREPAFPDWLRAMHGPRGAEGPAAIYWKQLGERKAAPAWIAGEPAPEPFEAMENGMRFLIDFTAGYSQGIFLDQRENRAETRRRARAMDGPRVLNCFAYTCAFGVAAALGGAATVNIDLSKRYLEWGGRNYALNGIEAAGHEFIYGEAGNWLERFARKGRRFDLVILDPPTFSRDRQGRVFTIEEGFPALVGAAAAVLTETGSLFCSTNQRTLPPGRFRRLIARGLPEPERWRIEERPMPADFTGERYLKACWVDRR